MQNDGVEEIVPALDVLVSCCQEAGISLSGTAKPGRKPAAAVTPPSSSRATTDKTDQAAQDR